ncbi:MAG TPA: RNA polymerase sigma factor SigJ [Blastocatellia bacterium]|nr:RNA polymerase sigma factor SigJ [Blastocatellia bacterium]
MIMQDVNHRSVIFEQSRRRLFGLAYRMLSSKADAEDMVQEAYLRWHQAPADEIRSPEAWLVTVVTRLCIDRLRSAAAERETYPGMWLPEPLFGESPDEQVELASNLSMAFMILLERLAPAERAAFLLRDVFDCPYSEIARIIGKSEAACRQIVSRARERVRRDQPRFEASEEDRLRLMEKFATAIDANDEQTLLALFAEDATLTSDGGGKTPAARNVIRGPERITRLFLAVARKLKGRVTRSFLPINGEPGLVTFIDGRPVSALSFVTDDAHIHALYNVLNPDKLKDINQSEK